MSKDIKAIKNTIASELADDIPVKSNLMSGYFSGIIAGQKEFNKVLGEGFDSSKVDDYAKSLSGLNTTQQTAVLMAAGLNKEQQKTVLTRAQNIASTKLNTAETNKNIASDVADAKSNAGNTVTVKASTDAINANTGAIVANTDAKYANSAADVVDTATDAVETVGDVAGGVVDAAGTGISILGMLGTKFSGLGKILTKIWGVVKGIGAGILAFAQAHPVIAGITLAVSALTAIFIGQKKAAEENAKAIKEAYEEAKKSIKETKKAFDDTKSQTNDIKQEYAELAQGVNLLNNENKKLTTEKYERFLELNNKLAELFPSLTKGYDENGNAILDLKGNVDGIVASLDALIQRQQQLTHQEVAKKMADVYNGFMPRRQDFQDDLAQFQRIQDEVAKAGGFSYPSSQKEISIESWMDKYDFYALVDRVEEELGEELNTMAVATQTGTVYRMWSDKGTKIPAELVNKVINDEIQELKGALEQERSALNQYLNSWMQTDFAFQQLDSGTQKTLQEIMFNFDFDKLPDNIDKNDWNEVSDYLQKKIINAINNCNDESVSVALSEVFSNAELSPDVKLDYLEQIQSYFGKEHPISITLAPQLEDAQDVARKYGLAVYEFGSESYDVLDEFFNQNSINTIDEIYKWDEITAGAESAAEAIEMYNEACDKIEPVDLGALSGMQELSKGFDQLASIYKDIADGAGFDYSSILNNADFNEAFGGYKEEYGNFIQTVANSPSDIEACQDAFNNLAKAYLYDKTALSEVTEENKQAIVLMLEQMGVTNALAIVEKQLIVNSANLETAQADLNRWKEQGVQLDIDLANATDDELVQLKNEAEALEQTDTALYGYVLDKLKARAVDIKTSGDIQQLANFCSSLGIATKAINNYNAAKLALEELEKGHDGRTNPSDYARRRNSLLKQIEDAEAQMNHAVTQFQNGEYQVDLGFNVDFGADKWKDDAKEKVDWIERYMSRLQSEMDTLNEKFSATWKTFGDRGQAALKKIALLRKKDQAQHDAYYEYLAEADKVGLDATTIQLIKEGRIADGIQEYDADKQKKISEYIKWYDLAQEAYKQQQATEGEIIATYSERFDLIANEYDAQINMNAHKASALENLLDQMESSGYMLSGEYYAGLIAIEEENQETLRDKRNALSLELQNAMKNGLQEGTEEWYNLKGQILEVDEAIQDSISSVMDYTNSMQELEWAKFEKTQALISEIHAEKDFLLQLLEDEEKFEEGGTWNKYANAAAGLSAVSYNTYMAQAKAYAEEIKGIDKDLAKDPANTKLLDKRQELLKAQRENILAAEDEKQALIDLAKEGFDAMMESLQELIDKRKEALQTSADLYEYQKNIAEQTKEVATLEKQLSAYNGDDSEEAQAKIQQLKVSLEEAKQNLEQSEYDRWKQDQEQMLDKLAEDTQEWIDERLENQEELLRGILDAVDGESGSIMSTLDTLAGDVGTSVSGELQKIFEIGAKDNVFTAVNTTLGTIATYVEFLAKEGFLSTYSQSDVDRVAQIIMDKTYEPTELEFEKYDLNNDGVISLTDLHNVIKKRDGYATGARRIKHDEVAWTQEKGQELIYRPSDGAMLTPLEADGAVFTSEMTRRLWDIASNPSLFSNLTSVSLPKGMNNAGNNIQNDVVLNISLPNVVDVDGFVNELKTNKKFEKVVQSITLGNALGQNSLSKYRY